MPSRVQSDPAGISFYTEVFEKEKVCQTRWYEENPNSVHTAITLNREPKNYSVADVQRCRIEGGVAILVKDNIVNFGNRYKLPPRDNDLVKLGNVKEAIPSMKPVPEEIKKLLHTDTRKVYLERRCAVSPVKKYNFIECTSWLYGWQFDPSDFKGSAYGKRYTITCVKGLRPQADPSHYQDCKDISNVCICT